MSKDLFWWVLSKIIASNHSNKEPEFDEEQTKQTKQQTREQPQKKKKQHKTATKRSESKQESRYFDADGGGSGELHDEEEEDESEDDDRKWLKSLGRREREEELEDAINLGAARRPSSSSSWSSSNRSKKDVEELMLTRLASTYLSLFRKTCFNIEYFVQADDPNNDFDDGLLPEALAKEPNQSIRAMSHRARRVCDKVVGAFPDALAQVVTSSLHCAAPRAVDDFGFDRLKECCSDVMSVLINGMRESKTRVEHWPVEKSKGGLGMRVRGSTLGTTTGGTTKKKSIGLHKELAMLSRNLDKVMVGGSGGSGGSFSSSSSSSSGADLHGSLSKREIGATSGGDDNGRVSDSPRNLMTTTTASTTNNNKQQTAASTKIKRKDNHSQWLEDEEGESLQLESRHVVTKTRFCLGNSHLIGKLVESNEMTSIMRKKELKITLTTSSRRPDLIPSVGTSTKRGGERGKRDGTDLFGWVARETLGRKKEQEEKERDRYIGGQKDGGSGGSGGRGGGGGGEERGEREEQFNNRCTYLHVPMTVRSALNESRSRIEKMMEKNVIAKKQKNRAVHAIKVRLGIDLQGISKEARRAKSGDVNELANELSGLNTGKKTKKKKR